MPKDEEPPCIPIGGVELPKPLLPPALPKPPPLPPALLPKGLGPPPRVEGCPKPGVEAPNPEEDPNPPGAGADPKPPGVVEGFPKPGDGVPKPAAEVDPNPPGAGAGDPKPADDEKPKTEGSKLYFFAKFLNKVSSLPAYFVKTLSISAIFEGLCC